MAPSTKTPNGTPSAPPASLKKSTSSSKNQTSIAGFFRKAQGTQASTNDAPRLHSSTLPINGLAKKGANRGSSQSLTPAPSSDAVAPEDVKEEENIKPVKRNGNVSNGLPSPITPASAVNAGDGVGDDVVPKGFYSPSRKVRVSGNIFGRELTISCRPKPKLSTMPSTQPLMKTTRKG